MRVRTRQRLACRPWRQFLGRDGEIEFLPLSEHDQGNAAANALLSQEPVQVVDIADRDAVGGNDDVAIQNPGPSRGSIGTARLHQHGRALLEPVKAG